MLAEIEAVINTQPLAYIYEKFQLGFSLTPAHFLNTNLRSFPLINTEVGYSPSEDSMMILLNKWKKDQKWLNMFLDMWRKEYLASLRERSSYHKSVKGQIHCTPGLGQVVLIKEGHIARDMWKLEKLNKDSDGHIRTAKINLPNGRYIQRSISQLHLLEVPDKSNKLNQVSNKMENGHSLQYAGHVQESERVPIRKAVIMVTARKRINDLLEANALTVTFYFIVFYFSALPQCHEMSNTFNY